LNFAHAAAKDILRAANGPSGGQSQGQGQGQSSPVPSRNGGGASVSVAQEGGSVVEPGLSAEEQVIQLKVMRPSVRPLVHVCLGHGPRSGLLFVAR